MKSSKACRIYKSFFSKLPIVSIILKRHKKCHKLHKKKCSTVEKLWNSIKRKHETFIARMQTAKIKFTSMALTLEIYV